MYDSIEEIEALIGEEETVSLEFKAGRMFEGQIDRTELVKDVTAFANAAGGAIIVGIAENRETRIATSIEPVSNESKVTIEQLTEIIKSNTDPVFGAFRIRELQHHKGRVFVIEVDQADTAHQNKRNFNYYQRLGPTSSPMYDFAIRDVMNRRTRPHVAVTFDVEDLEQLGSVAVRIVPIVTNEGSVTARHWSLWLDLPANVSTFGAVRPGMPARHMGNVKRNGIDYRRVEFHSGPNLKNQAGTLLLPGQTWRLNLDSAFPELDLRVTATEARWTEANRPPVHWTLFLDDSPRQEGMIPYSDWSR